MLKQLKFLKKCIFFLFVCMTVFVRIRVRCVQCLSTIRRVHTYCEKILIYLARFFILAFLYGDNDEVK